MQNCGVNHRFFFSPMPSPERPSDAAAFRKRLLVLAIIAACGLALLTGRLIWLQAGQ
jgi:hypothetical protein